MIASNEFTIYSREREVDGEGEWQYSILIHIKNIPTSLDSYNILKRKRSFVCFDQLKNYRITYKTSIYLNNSRIFAEYQIAYT